MKSRKIETIWVAAFLLMSIYSGFAQNEVTLIPNPKDLAQCPGINTTFTLSSNFNAACHTITPNDNVTVVSIITNPNTNVSTVTLNFFDAGAKAKLTIVKSSDSNCSGAANGKEYDEIPIKTLVAVTPTITGPSSSPVGFINTHQYTASLNYPFRGTNDPNPLPVTNFNWTLPPGWVNTTIPSTSSTITVVTDISSGGDVSATPIHSCVNASVFASSKAVQRTLSSPCPVSADLAETYCGVPALNGLSATAQPTGYTASPSGLKYTWTLPTDWTIIGSNTSRNIDVMMDGQHGGIVTVVAKDYGVNSPVCPLDIPLRVINSTASVVGVERLCETNTYNLSHPLSAGASATWAITTPNAPISPLQGNGPSATLTPTIGGLSMPGSSATLDFTITGCGITKTISKSFFVGRPNINGHRIDGVAGASKNVCPGWHILVAQVLGDDSSPPCMTWELVNNQGTPPHTLYYGGCDWAMVYMNPLNSAPAFVRVTSDNECGPTISYFYLYPILQNCKENYNFIIYPNPASSVLNLEVQFDDGQNEAIPLTIGHAQLVNMMGTIALDLPNIDSDAVEMDLSSIPNGLYVVRAQVGNEWLTETVQVSKN